MGIAIVTLMLFATPAYCHRLEGNASFYNSGWKTASGERFSTKAMKAAHFSIPMGTKVRVNNLENGNSIIVVINDRGPFYKRGRYVNTKRPHQRHVIDLTPAAFKSLGAPLSKGIVKVKIEILEGEEDEG